MRHSCGSCLFRMVAAVGLCAGLNLFSGCKQKTIAVAPANPNLPKSVNLNLAPPVRAQNSSPVITGDLVDKAISRGCKYLYASSHNDQWGAPDAEDSHVGNQTALVLRALLQSGEDARNPRIAHALKPLMQADFKSTQSIADRLAIMNLQLHPHDAEMQNRLKREANLLIADIPIKASATGFHPGATNITPISIPASAQASIALAEAHDYPLELAATYWEVVDAGWRRLLKRELIKGPAISPEGLCALDLMPELRALDVLTTVDDRLHVARADAKAPASDELVDTILRQIQANYPAIFRGPGEFEALEAFARIMRSRGQRFVGSHDWYQEAALLLLKTQRGDGSWGDGVNDTAYALLFLSRNRAMVLFNKLQYSNAHGLAPSWNNRPADLAHFTRWIGEQLERPFDWQVLNVDAPIEDWQTAPILYISGDTTLDFGPEQRAKMKQFIEMGGMIVGHADSGDMKFSDSFTKLGQTLFPPYKFRDLPRDHLLFNEFFRGNNWRVHPLVRGLSNGVRELMVLFPTDQSRAWQLEQFIGIKELPSAQLAANLVLYATDRNFSFKEDQLQYRANPGSIIALAHTSTPSLDAESLKNKIVFSRDLLKPPPAPQAPFETLTLAVIAVQADAATIPNYDSLRAAMLLKHGKVNVDPLVLGKWTLQRYDLASIAVGQLWSLPPLKRLEIKRFIETGGTLYIDASANPEKVPAAEGQLARIFTEAKLVFGPQSPADSLVKVAPQPIRIGHLNNRAAVIVNAHADQGEAILQSLLEAHLK